MTKQDLRRLRADLVSDGKIVAAGYSVAETPFNLVFEARP